MRKLTTTMKTLMLVAAFIWPAMGAMGQVIITQYYEGTSNNKYIEITNLGASDVDLSTYYLGRWSGTDTPTGAASNSSQLSGTIAAGATQVYMNADAVDPAYAVTNSVGTTTATYFNGDDPVALLNGSNDWADVVDCIYGSIASGNWGDNRSFVRKSTVTTGNTSQSVLDGSGEWEEVTLATVDGAAATDTEYLGTHVFGSANTNDPDSYVDATGVTQPTGSSIPSTDWNASSPTATPVFQFNIADAGTADGLPTEVTAVTIKAGANNTAIWNEDIGGGYLYKESSGTQLTIVTEAFVTANSVTFYIEDGELDVADGGSELVTLYVWPEENTTDNAVIECIIDAASHGFTADVTGSDFAADFGTDVTGEQFTIGVDATLLSFITEPTDVEVGAIMSPAIEVATTDINGNVDVDYAATDITLTNVGGGTMGGTTTVATTAGVATFSDLTFDLNDPACVLTATGGTFPEVNSAMFDVNIPFVASKLLITEIVVTPTAGEFVEIYNPGTETIDLSNYYITDATFAGGSTYYYNITTGANAGGGSFGDWHARFPDGATIAPDEAQTIALTGSDDFFATYSVDCTYELYEDGASADAIPDMREALSGSINDQGGFTNSGEVCVLYAWNGSSDLVTDVDYFMWGDNAEGIDKTGVTIGSSTYNPDTDLASQEFMAGTHVDGSSWQRIDMTEGTQTATGSNGVDGRDETSENITVTFSELAATPNEIPSFEAPIIANITISPETPTTSDQVSVSADVTDDGTIDSVALLWGTTSGTIIDTIKMSVGTGVTYTTESLIPDQIAGATVYYMIVAIDNDAQETITPEMSYDVVAAPTQVSDIATLRAGAADGTVYELTGEAILTFQQSYRGQKYVQDATGGIIIDDDAGNITSTYNRYDGITGLTGTLNIRFGVVQFIPTADPGAATSNNNTVTPVTTTISDLTGAVSDYESELVLLEGLTFADAGGTFATGTNYELGNGTNTISMRTEFYGADYIGEAIPSGPQNIVALVAQYNGSAQVYVRESADMTPATTDAPIVSNIVISPVAPTSSDLVNVTVTVEDADANLSTVVLMWGEVFQTNTINMQLVSGDTWETSEPIPAQDNLVTIQFTITATDLDSNEGSATGSYTVFDPFTGDLPFLEPFLGSLNEMIPVDALGAQSWGYDEYNGDGYAKMTGYVHPDALPNEDWLLTPALDFTGITEATLVFNEAINYAGTIENQQEVYISTNYDGGGDPSTASWTELTVTGRAAGNNWTFVTVDDIDLSAYAGEPSVYIAFVYTSDDTDAATWELDNISVSGGVGIADAKVNNLSIYPNPAQNEVFVSGVENISNVEIISLDGKVVMSEQTNDNRIDVSSINDGLYIVRVISGNEVYTTRFVKE